MWLFLFSSMTLDEWDSQTILFYLNLTFSVTLSFFIHFSSAPLSKSDVF